MVEGTGTDHAPRQGAEPRDRCRCSAASLALWRRWCSPRRWSGRTPCRLARCSPRSARRLTGAPPQGQIDTVLFEVRLPRVLAAVLVGAALAAAGAAYQTLFRNPLVSPDILGVSTGAGLGAVLGIFLSLPVAGIQLSAFAMGLATVGLVYAIASMVHGRDPILVLVLAGVVVGSLPAPPSR